MTVLIAALWGFSEATLFFIVPDVFLTVIVLRDRRAALLCCGAAVAWTAFYAVYFALKGN